ncbi:hypothetical protein [Halodesulfovibrio spirochaetisodalis]|uniref:Uncharacterized protein n=1 Tax=Halodesulfovibrio spirochaetisodalis TaxID=1560234 RepID=A0A1B7XPQ8_9BACT|nr:hypothetical protein [Halodesulfovibrio spirochaetisodalis]OBQ57501.1 hypothetical protein SP90_00145 [Halodesulfovibrio spirochaetisodalis]
MVAITEVMNKTMEMAQLQKAAKAMREKAASVVSMSNLFVNQQTDHSDYIRASIQSSKAVHEAMDNKMNTMTSLLQAQIAYESNNQAENKASYHGPLDLSYSRRARIGARAGVLLQNEQSSAVQRSSDAVTERDNATERSRVTSLADDSGVSRPVQLARVLSVQRSVRSAPAKISIRV